MHKPTIAAAVFLVVLVAWMLRWEPIPLSGGNLALLDRWTGTVRVISSGSWRIIEDAKQPQ